MGQVGVATLLFSGLGTRGAIGLPRRVRGRDNFGPGPGHLDSLTRGN